MSNQRQINVKKRQVILKVTQALSIVSNIFPINSSISVIWKQQARATSHAPPEAFPIMYVYRKLEVAIMPVYRKLKSPTCNGLQSKRAGTAISVFLGPH
jgi:hypothetical protein